MDSRGPAGGIGIDLVEVGRVAGLLARRPAAEERLFTAAERDYCRGSSRAAERFAARVAAKESVGKALGTGVIVWREIEVLGGGRPQVRLHGRTADAARAMGVASIDLSLSHTAAFAAAVALVVPGPRTRFVAHDPSGRGVA